MSIFYNDAWFIGSVFDALGNVVQFNDLVPEQTGIEMEPINQVHSTGDYQSGERNAVMLAGIDFSGETQLQTWKNDRTPVAAVALSRSGIGRNLRWTDFLKLKELFATPKPLRSEGDAFIKATLEDFDVDPVRERNLANSAGGTSIILPLAGPELTLAAESGVLFDLTLRARDFAGLELAFTTTSFNNERGTVQLVLPANTWTVEWELNGAVNASLRADGSSEFIAG